MELSCIEACNTEPLIGASIGNYSSCYSPIQEASSSVSDESTCKYSNKQKKALFEKINSLSSTEHEEIHRVISAHNVNTSKNKNGVFFNLSSVSDEVIEQIDKFVNYCISNKDKLDEYDKRLNECKINNNFAPIVNMNINLENMVQVESPDEVKDDWSKVKAEDTKSYTRFIQFAEKMHEEKDKLHLRRVNSKFINAKKRFSKRIVCDKKIEFDHIDELAKESYIL